VHPLYRCAKMTELYQPPKVSLHSITDGEQLMRRRKFWLRAIWTSIAAVILPPMLGLIVTAVRITTNAGNGSSDLQSLAGDIARSLLVSTVLGLAVSVVGLIFLIGAAIRLFTLPRLVVGPPHNPEAQQAGSSYGG
jgi:ABC-type Fe3+ transport system permease subunit